LILDCIVTTIESNCGFEFNVVARSYGKG